MGALYGRSYDPWYLTGSRTSAWQKLPSTFESHSKHQTETLQSMARFEGLRKRDSAETHTLSFLSSL